MKKRDVLFAIIAVVSISAAVFSHVRRRKVEAFLCGSQMSSIAQAAKNWAEENQRALPSNFAFLSYQSTPGFLICPLDHFHQAAKDWTSFTSDNSSYQILTPGAPLNNTNLFLRCGYHNFDALIDGSVQDGNTQHTKAYFGR